MPTEKLLSCPFCNNTPEQSIACAFRCPKLHCPASFQWVSFEAWQNRTPSPELVELRKRVLSDASKIGVLTGALDGCRHQVDKDLKLRIENVLKEASDDAAKEKK